MLFGWSNCKNFKAKGNFAQLRLLKNAAIIIKI